MSVQAAKRSVKFISTRYTKSTRAILVLGGIGIIVMVGDIFIFGVWLPRAEADRQAREGRADRQAFLEYVAKAGAGDANAQFNLGECFAAGRGVIQDEGEAVKWFRRSAEKNLPEAQRKLGHCFAAGRGVEPDGGEAAKWYRRAAEGNDAEAPYNLAFCYANGLWVTRDYTEAYAWYQVACVKYPEAAGRSLNLAGQMSPQQIFEGKERAEKLRTIIGTKR